jgi:hypothetical protein
MAPALTSGPPARARVGPRPRLGAHAGAGHGRPVPHGDERERQAARRHPGGVRAARQIGEVERQGGGEEHGVGRVALGGRRGGGEFGEHRLGAAQGRDAVRRGGRRGAAGAQAHAHRHVAHELLEHDRGLGGAGAPWLGTQSAGGEQHVRRTHRGVPGERHLAARREDAYARRPAPLGRQHERRLGVVELARHREHLVGRQPAGVEHHGQRVAAELAVGEHVGGDVAVGAHGRRQQKDRGGVAQS